MPRLSLYRPQKGSDYKFIDRTVYEMFQVGGVDVFLHKYIGPTDPSDPNKAMGATSIQDVLFLENRDRKYDADVYNLRGVYNVQDTDFNLSQFGLFLQNDTVFLTVHINNTVDILGRKVMSGDVVELPNMKDEYAANDYAAALKRFYVVEDVNRASEGYSATWYPHLYRLKLKPIIDSQEFKDILERPMDDENFAGDYDSVRTYYPGEVVRFNGTLYYVIDAVGPAGTTLTPPDSSAWAEYFNTTLRDVMSTYEKEMQINNAVILEAESDAPKSGYDVSHYFTLAVDPDTGRPIINTADTSQNLASTFNIGDEAATPVREGYTGYLMGDGLAPNGPEGQFGFGIQFPQSPLAGDTFLRTDYLPNRLFQWDGFRWMKQEDNVRMTLTNNDERQTQKTSFINNATKSGIDKLKSDVIDMTRTPMFTTGNGTVDFEVRVNGLYVLTDINYNADLQVEVWVNESGKAVTITKSNESGKLSFVIGHPEIIDARIRWTVYDGVVEQRQSLSKALRKIKPQADI